ncbi:MAG: hypothetical protein R3266_00425 [Gemmatimonadota bacterium]|nr:hypothetical protein [Gemmatimonadota bacterium]
MKLSHASLGLALAVAACAGNPAPGEPGYDYNLDGTYIAEFVGDDGTVFTGSMTLETLPGGEVTGTMDLVDPLAITGQVGGLIVGSEASFEVTFDIPDQGCGGIVAGSGVIAAGGGGVEGMFDDITDDCGGAPTSISFTLVLDA